MGRRRRCALSASRARVSSFSLASSSLRAASHSSWEAMRGRFVLMALRPPCGGNLIGTARQGEPEPVTALAWSASQRATVLASCCPASNASARAGRRSPPRPTPRPRARRGRGSAEGHRRVVAAGAGGGRGADAGHRVGLLGHGAVDLDRAGAAAGAVLLGDVERERAGRAAVVGGHARAAVVRAAALLGARAARAAASPGGRAGRFLRVLALLMRELALQLAQLGLLGRVLLLLALF